MAKGRSNEFIRGMGKKTIALGCEISFTKKQQLRQTVWMK
jgi:hypothetical protein